MVLARRRPRKARSRASQERIRQVQREVKEMGVLDELFRMYDADGSHKLELDDVRKLLTDMAKGTPPTEEEIAFIVKTCDKENANGAIDRSELKEAILAWRHYTGMRDVLQEAMDKYDKSGDGKLEKREMKMYLEDLNGGIAVTDEEVDWVLSQADLFGEGAISKPELMMAAAVWHAHVESKGTVCCEIQ